jgi:hypothetical protein
MNPVSGSETLHLQHGPLPAAKPQYNEKHPRNTVTASGSPRQVPQSRPKAPKEGRKQGNDTVNQGAPQRVPSSQTLHQKLPRELSTCQRPVARNSSVPLLQDLQGSNYPPLKTQEVSKKQAIWAHLDPGAVGQFSPNVQMPSVIPDHRDMGSHERIERVKETFVRR